MIIQVLYEFYLWVPLIVGMFLYSHEADYMQRCLKKNGSKYPGPSL